MSRKNTPKLYKQLVRRGNGLGSTSSNGLPVPAIAPPTNGVDASVDHLRSLMGPLKQRDLAKLVKISEAHVSLIFHRKRLPSMPVAVRLAKALHIRLDQLHQQLGA